MAKTVRVSPTGLVVHKKGGKWVTRKGSVVKKVKTVRRK
jgi:hypothetical protein